MAHGRARHSQSQGGIERLNRRVEEKMAKWCKDNDSNHWATVGRNMVRWQVHLSSSLVVVLECEYMENSSSAWKVVEFYLPFCLLAVFQINTEQTEATGQMPYETTFGQEQNVLIMYNFCTDSV